MNEVKDFNWDKYNVLLTNEGSNGDSAHHTAYYWFLKAILGQSIDVMSTRQFYVTKWIHTDGVEDIEMRRHPDRVTTDFSRDQFTPFLALLPYDSMNDWRTAEYYDKVVANKLIFFNSHDSSGPEKEWWNRDILDPATVGLYLRGIRNKGSLWLWLTDLHLLSAVWFRIKKVKKEGPDSTADENILLHLIVAKTRFPTKISDYAAKYYFKNRPDNDGGKGWAGAHYDFWTRNGTYIPGMPNLVFQVVKKVFGLDAER